MPQWAGFASRAATSLREVRAVQGVEFRALYIEERLASIMYCVQWNLS